MYSYSTVHVEAMIIKVSVFNLLERPSSFLPLFNKSGLELEGRNHLSQFSIGTLHNPDFRIRRFLLEAPS